MLKILHLYSLKQAPYLSNLEPNLSPEWLHGVSLEVKSECAFVHSTRHVHCCSRIVLSATARHMRTPPWLGRIGCVGVQWQDLQINSSRTLAHRCQREHLWLPKLNAKVTQPLKTELGWP